MMVQGSFEKDFHPVQDTDEEGGFVRSTSVFRHWITPDGSAGPGGNAGFKAEAGRYHLYVALICPWACRTLMARKLKGLEDVISISVVDPRLTEKVWKFGGQPDSLQGSHKDPLHNYEYIYQLYLRADPVYTGEITVPVLWDKKNHTIVNNESSEIIRMLNNGFGNLANNAIDLYPQELQDEIDTVNHRLYDRFNNGVYRCGFATTQVAYENALQDVLSSMEFIEQRLQKQDYLVGNRLTEADIRAFVTLIRFDLAYFSLFKINIKQARAYPRIRAYLQRIYELPGIAETVNAEHIKSGYYSIEALNPSRIVPLGPATLW